MKTNVMEKIFNESQIFKTKQHLANKNESFPGTCCKMFPRDTLLNVSLGQFD